MAKQALGRGIGALLGATKLAAPQPDRDKGERVQQVPLGDIVPSPFQPRKHFNEEKLTELTESIRERGIVQPLIVRTVSGKFELIAGERRWRASQNAGLKDVPVIVRSASDREVLELALVENLQRADLNPLEEAEAYALLINEFKLTQEEVARRVGKNRVSVANAVRLLSLHEELRAWLSSGQLSVGHAKVLLSLTSPREQRLVAERVLKDNLTVRQTEKLIESLQSGRKPAPRGKSTAKTTPDSEWKDLEKRLQQHLGTRVRLLGSNNAGRVEIEYFSADELDRILKHLGLSDL